MSPKTKIVEWEDLDKLWQSFLDMASALQVTLRLRTRTKTYKRDRHKRTGQVNQARCQFLESNIRQKQQMIPYPKMVWKEQVQYSSDFISIFILQQHASVWQPFAKLKLDAWLSFCGAFTLSFKRLGGRGTKGTAESAGLRSLKLWSFCIEEISKQRIWSAMEERERESTCLRSLLPPMNLK